jgi:simple sugar transport system permease protein
VVSVTTLTVYSTPEVVPPAGAYWTRNRKAGAVLVAIGVIAAGAFGAATRAGGARFTLGTTINATSLPIPGRLGAIGFGLLCALCGAALLIPATGRRAVSWLLAGSLVALVLSFLCWQVAGHVMPLGNVAGLTVVAALPLVYGAQTGVLGERTGVINVAIEGQLLIGAFAGALVGTMAGSDWAGLVAAGLGGMLLGALLAVLAIRYRVDQVVLGVVLNLLALGITGFLYTQVMQQDGNSYNFPPIFSAWAIPGLSKIPVIGPALFDQNIFVYLAIVLVVGLHIGLNHTRWGLRTRAVGEHPTAADTVGIKVRGMRYRNVILGGLVAGVGGASLTIGAVGAFNNNMTGGRGFIALAALIFGRWNPLGATVAALLFGFCGALANFLGSINSSIPSEFLNMLPYAVTIVAVAGLVGRVRAPAADGQPYVKG